MLFALVAGGLLFGSASIAFALVAWWPPHLEPGAAGCGAPDAGGSYTASRATASVLLAVLIGAAVQGTRANFLLGTDPTDRFYADTFTSDQRRARRGRRALRGRAARDRQRGRGRTAPDARRPQGRRHAQADARCRHPRRDTLPLVPVIAAATIAGLMASRGLFGSSVNAFDAVNGTSSTLVAVPIPWLRLMVLAGGAVATSTLVTAGSLALLGPSSDPTELRAAA
ncbi:MAG: hypothetical protein R2705_22115 [Ilumatobacteraceae bacterium]